MLVGAHISIGGSIDMAVDRALKLGCNTFQIFTRNPRGWQQSPLTEESIQLFRKKLSSSNLMLPLIHMPYLPNIASPVDQTYNRSVEVLTEELRRSSLLAVPYVVTHVGSHLGSGIKRGMARVVDACNKALELSGGSSTILLENTAGTRNSVGSTFEHLSEMIRRIKPQERIGICLDTCHAFAAGYDLRTVYDVRHTLELLHSIIGIDFLKAVHVNDSKGSLGEGLDRHEHLGMGQIGEGGLRAFLNQKPLTKVPTIIETPIDGRRDDVGNLKKLRELIQN
ncbi:MAG: deoxyribonuclease IV [Nitrososphaerales archaeon]